MFLVEKSVKRSDSQLASFLDHLDELRRRLITCLIVFVLAIFVVYPFIDRMIYYFVKPIGYLVFSAPSEAFMGRMILNLWAAFFVSLPVTLFQIWRFIEGGLKDSEKKWVAICIPISIGLFFLGALFAYAIVVPLTLKFFMGFSSEAFVWVGADQFGSTCRFALSTEV